MVAIVSAGQVIVPLTSNKTSFKKICKTSKSSKDILPTYKELLHLHNPFDLPALASTMATLTGLNHFLPQVMESEACFQTHWNMEFTLDSSRDRFQARSLCKVHTKKLMGDAFPKFSGGSREGAR